ncbi:MAG: hypothetical protein M0Z63_13805 [Actinomycetota bacterium]|nr:hypothetical protein [Actinomycetota bacterium]
MTVASVAGAMGWSLLAVVHGDGMTMWRVPGDIWGTLRGAHVIAWGDIGGVYLAGTGLVSFPGTAVLLVPVALASSALGLTESFPYPLPHPTAWLVLGPYDVMVASVALFAVDALARRLEVPAGRRAWLSVAGAIALFPVDGLWGHPEDAVAVGLLLYALLAGLDGRFVRAGWLAGAAVAVQPLVLLGLPVLAAVVGWRRLPGLVVRAALPAAALVAVCLVGAEHATVHALLDQPNFPRIDRVTPWTALAPRVGGRGRSLAVAAGPGRLVALAGAVAVGGGLWWRWRAAAVGARHRFRWARSRRAAGLMAAPGDVPGAGLMGVPGDDVGASPMGVPGDDVGASPMGVPGDDVGASPMGVPGDVLGASPMGVREATSGTDAVGCPVAGPVTGSAAGSTAGAAAGLAFAVGGPAVVWVLAVALSLRCLTESVMDPYYLWPPLGVGLLAAATASGRAGGKRFAVAAVAVVATTVVAEMHLVWWVWWYSVMFGMLVTVACGFPGRVGRRHSSSVPWMPLAQQEREHCAPGSSRG